MTTSTLGRTGPAAHGRLTGLARLLAALAWLLALAGAAPATGRGEGPPARRPAAAPLVGPPTITGYTPSQAVGLPLVINGTNLTGISSVRFGELPAPAGSYIVNAAGTQLVVPVPVLASSNVVTVTTSLGTATTATRFQVTRASSVVAYARTSPLQAGGADVNVGFTSAPTVSDLDGDGLLDLLVGNIDGNVARYEQTSATAATFTGLGILATAGGTIDVGTSSAPTVTDLDGNGLLDLLVGSVSGTVARYEQISTTAATFASLGNLATSSGAINVGSEAAPTVTDLDGDGLLDLLVGTSSGTVARYEQASANAVTFTSLGTLATSSGAINVNGLAAPTVSDLDGDGLLDLLVGDNDGNVARYEQTSANATTFGAAFPLVSAQLTSAVRIKPVVTDLNGDGRLDLLAGNFYGSVVRFEQVAAPTITSFSPASGAVGTQVVITGTNLTGATGVRFGELPAPAGSYIVNAAGTQLTVTVPVLASSNKLSVTNAAGTALTATRFQVTRASSVVAYTRTSNLQAGGADVDAGGSSAPTMTDLDGNGLLDLLVGNDDGNVVRYEQTSATAATFTGLGTLQAEGTAIDVGFTSAPTVTDLDGDGLLDLLVGNASGNVVRYEQTSATAATFTGLGNLTTGSAVVGVGGSATPTVTDLDGDGLLDLLVGNVAGTVVRFEQTSATAATFASLGTLQAGGTAIDVVGNSAPTVTDLDGNGLLDLLVGDVNGTVVRYEQTGANNSAFRTAAFPLVSAQLTPSVRVKPVVTDLDGDGRLDLLVGNSNGIVARFEQVPAPTLTSISPGSGPVGTSVTLTGTDLSGATAVSFNGTAATTFSVVNATTITATVPAGATTGPVTVTTPGGPSNGVAFTVTPAVTSFSPASGVVGTLVTIVGTNLTGATLITFGGTSNNTVSTGYTVNAAGTSITGIVVPGGAATGPISVSTPGGMATSATSFTVTLPTTAAPTLTTPATGSTVSGTPTFAGTASAGSTVTLYLAAGSATAQPIGTTTAPNGSFSFVPATALASGSYSAYATAQGSGATVSAPSNTTSFTVDATPPTATISTTSGSSTSTAPIPFSVIFSEPVTGLSASSFTVFNGTVTSGPTNSGTNAYAFSVTPTGNGTVTVSLAANAVRDAVGNGNKASNSVSVQYTAPVATGLSVQYQTGDLGQPTDGQLRPFLQLVNTGASAVPYSSLTIRYWLTVENFMGQLVTPIDYAKLGTGFVSARYVPLATPRQGAFGYIEYSFSAGAGNLAAGTNSGPIYGKAYKPDYTNFNETDDWSYQTSSSFTTNDHVTLYQNGTLIGGTEPTAVASTTSIRVFAGNQDTSPTTSYINVTLQVGNVGNRPVNYSDLTVRYYFTRDGANTIVPQVDYAKLGANNISVRYVPLATPLNGADGYLEIGFSSALGVFYPSTNTDNIQFKIRKGDYTAFTQTNDYSFSSSSAVVAQPRVPAYLNGTLVYGTEPSAAIATVTRDSQETSAKGSAADADAAATSAPLALALTASPNPFGEQLRLAFALPTTQAYTLAVYDGQGRLVQQLASGEAAAGQAQELAVPTQGYAAGLYLVRLTTASGTQHLKLIKH